MQSRTSGHRRNFAFHGMVAAPITEALRTLELERGRLGGARAIKPQPALARRPRPSPHIRMKELGPLFTLCLQSKRIATAQKALWKKFRLVKKELTDLPSPENRPVSGFCFPLYLAWCSPELPRHGQLAHFA
jgi:hypothetical protein